MSAELLDPNNAVPGDFRRTATRIAVEPAAAPALQAFVPVFFNRGYGAGSLKYPLFEAKRAGVRQVDLRTSQNYSWPRNESPTYDTMGARSLFFFAERRSATWPALPPLALLSSLPQRTVIGSVRNDERPSAYYGEATLAGPRRTTTWSESRPLRHPSPRLFHPKPPTEISSPWSNLW